MIEQRYRITYFLGGGGAAQVFLARDTQLDRDVAIKVLNQSLAADARFLRRFRAEGRAVAALDHNHIVKVYDYRELPNELEVPYLIMEYLGGGNLRAVLDHGTLDIAQTLGLGIQAAAALDHAARRGVVHRDIKPANLLFGMDGNLKIADFGIARAMSESSPTEQHDALWGTTKYMSPEQSTGRSVTDKTDVYSLALVMVEAISGEVPFVRDNPVATLDARRNHDLVAPPEVGPLAPVIEAAGRRDPDQRCSARELYDALIELSSQFSRPDPIPLAGAVPPAELDAARREAELAAASAAAQAAAPSMTAAEAPNVEPAAAPVATAVVEPPPFVTPAEHGADVEGNESDGEWAEAGAAAAPAQNGQNGQNSENGQNGQNGQDAAGPGAASPAVGGIIDLIDPTTPIPIAVDVTEMLPAPPGASTGGESAAAPSPVPGSSAPALPATDASTDAPVETARSPRLWPWVVASILLVSGLVAGGVYWWTELRIPRNPVLNVIGEDEASAVQSLKDLGFEVAITHTRRDGTVANEVIDQDPEAGTELEEGKTVELTVSLGNTLVALPDLPAGQIDEPTAVAAIDAAELVAGEPQRPFDEAVGVGLVISATPQVAPDASGQVPKGTVIDLVISAGPAPRRVPAGLVGQPIAVVRQLLADTQLGISEVQEFSDQPIDTVLRVSTPEGTEVPRDTVIEVVISKGPELFAVPNVVGETGTRADEILRAAGFTVSAVTGSPSAAVVAQDPAAGTLHVRNTAVRLLTNR